MKKVLLLLTALMFAASTAQFVSAQEKSRAEVKADARKATKARETARGEDCGPVAQGQSTKARKDVVADARKATAAGQTARGEDCGPVAATKSEKERAAVRKEAAAAAKAGQTSRGEADPPQKK